MYTWNHPLPAEVSWARPQLETTVANSSELGNLVLFVIYSRARTKLEQERQSKTSEEVRVFMSALGIVSQRKS